ncbi:tRNA (guanine-N(7)-)-methyltransferase [Gordonia araii NBRC 100433]|uniref:tRNA (guanine-N(7)-)-methyltransferase n=1 Tax=Gordonia araii NBRC 100433 TaxID=1073574 RepID=G7H6E6_9ACTN|nr:tRNA (guanosine(46)-N7)-methyltransferase TrmB [Gordonia araii]NNG96101.1 tRNA (guanosine(46)-N7)-methyltransferase TrmB [Gordonia araii NBRC 100433]GAB11421.1 tRNA (guanine-N(7)-)-methyltransferase [Gordonia araii NBRC 100433]
MSDTVDQSRLYPRVTSFRFRRGTLTPGQRRNWENLWPELGRDLRIGRDPDGTVTEPPLNAAEWFGRDAPLILEIGSGTGISTAAMAAEEPEFDVIAVEVYQPGLAQLVGLVDRGGLTNVRMIRGDAVVVLDELIEPKSLLGIRVFFPDPWPKARHHKRRLLQSGTLAMMAERLVDGGVLHIATDHADYTEWIRELLDNQDTSRTHLVPLAAGSSASGADHALATESPISLARPTTKFEGRAADEGRVVTEFIYTRAEGEK